MISIKLETAGEIIKGENPGWYIRIHYDPIKTGGYYIFQFKSKDSNNKEGFDNWVETYEEVESFFDEEWEIDWDENE